MLPFSFPSDVFEGPFIILFRRPFHAAASQVAVKIFESDPDAPTLTGLPEAEVRKRSSRAPLVHQRFTHTSALRRLTHSQQSHDLPRAGTAGSVRDEIRPVRRSGHPDQAPRHDEPGCFDFLLPCRFPDCDKSTPCRSRTTGLTAANPAGKSRWNIFGCRFVSQGKARLEERCADDEVLQFRFDAGCCSASGNSVNVPAILSTFLSHHLLSLPVE
jgi:hypothetical protein